MGRETAETTDSQQQYTARTTGRLRRAVRRVRDAFRRAKGYNGPERATLVLMFKSGLAGTLSWGLATYAAASPQPTYAPFTALLVVQSTAYRSLLQSVRYVCAVVLGVLAAGAAGPLLGENAAAFAVMLGVALVIGRWQRLGSQGTQVAVAAVFAHHAVSGTQQSMLGQIVLMALLGAVVGLAVSLFVVPPLHYRAAARGLNQVSQTLCALLRDMADGLRDGMPERDTVTDWLQRARQLDQYAATARRAVESGSESVIWNPRRLLRPGSTPTSFTGYRTLVEALTRAGEQLRSICYALLRIIDDEDTAAPGDEFLRVYAELLDVICLAPGSIGAAAEDGDGHGPLGRTLRDGRARHHALSRACDGADAWPTYGVLLTDAERLLTEFGQAHSQGALHPPPETA